MLQKTPTLKLSATSTANLKKTCIAFSLFLHEQEVQKWNWQGWSRVNESSALFLLQRCNTITYIFLRMLAAVQYCLPGHKKRPRCWCWAEPPSSPRAPSREPALWQSWWHGAGWREDWFQGTSCRGSAPRCRAPRREAPLSDIVLLHSNEGKSCDTNLVLFAFLNLVVQAQLDQVEHHAEDMFRHVLMIHPDLKHIKQPTKGDLLSVLWVMYY